MKQRRKVNGKPQQMEAACNALRTFFAEVVTTVPSAIVSEYFPPITSPVATAPSINAQMTR